MDDHPESEDDEPPMDRQDIVDALSKIKHQGMPKALLYTFTVSLAIVLQAVQLMKSREYATKAVNIVQIVLVVVSLLSMALMKYSFNRMLQDLQNDTNTTARVRFWKPLNIRYIALGLSTLGSMATFMVNIVMMTKCISNFSTDTLIQLLTSVLTVVFIFIQYLFIWRYQTQKPANHGMKIAVMISTNVYIAIGSLFNFAGKISDRSNPDDDTDDLWTLEQNDFPASCRNGLQSWLSISNILNRILYTFTFGYGIYCVAFLCHIWTKPIHNAARNRSSSTSSDDSGSVNINTQHRNLLATMLRYIWLLVRFGANHSAICSLILCISVFSLYTASCIQHNVYVKPEYLYNNASSQTMLKDTASYVMATYYYLVSFVAFIGALLVRAQRVEHRQFSVDDFLLLLGLFGQLVLIFFQTFSDMADLSKYTDDKNIKISFIFKLLFHFLGVMCQSYIVLKYSSQKHVRFSTGKRRLLIHAVIVFLGICNAQIWVRDSLLPPIALEYLGKVHADVLEVNSWWYILRPVMAVVAFYRIQSALMCYEILNDCFQRRR